MSLDSPHAKKRHLSQTLAEQNNTVNQARLGRSARRPELSQELNDRLTKVGMRARKAVSDGYQHQTSLPSYQGQTIGPTYNTPGSFRFTTPDGSMCSSIDSTSLAGDSFPKIEKRSREQFSSCNVYDDDEGTDIDEEDDGPHMSSAQAALQSSQSSLRFTQEPPVLDKQQKRLYIARGFSSQIN